MTDRQDIQDSKSRESIKAVGACKGVLSEFPELIDLQAFCAFLGVDEAEISDCIANKVSDTNLRYRFLTEAETNDLCDDIESTIGSGRLSKSGPEKLATWEKGWGENRSAFAQSGELSCLKPRFVRDGFVKRLDGRFIIPHDDDFESKFFSLIREAVYELYLATADHVYEFGAGTGHNLVAFRRMNPIQGLVGTDWSRESVALMSELNQIGGMDIDSLVFDMFSPDLSMALKNNSAVLTVGAIEQLGTSYWPFLFYLLRQKTVSVFVHFETFNEFYDRNTRTDELAVRYCAERNYISGFITALKYLEGYGLVEIISCRRIFGGQFHEGYSYIVWRRGADN